MTLTLSSLWVDSSDGSNRSSFWISPAVYLIEHLVTIDNIYNLSLPPHIRRTGFVSPEDYGRSSCRPAFLAGVTGRSGNEGDELCIANDEDQEDIWPALNGSTKSRSR